MIGLPGRRGLMLVATAIASFCATQTSESADGSDATPKKIVLVELFCSQGCDMCPSAERLMGQLSSLGYGPDRVVPLAFHVDYFNKPWRDPFSNAQYSRREWEYSQIYDRTNNVGKPDYLYFTPMLMVDGRVPMLASSERKDQTKAREALDAALKQAPTVRLSLRSTDDGESGVERKTWKIAISVVSPELDGRDVLVGVAAFEDPISTRVPSGENAGKTYVNHFVVRKLHVERARLAKETPTVLDLPISLEPGAKAANCGLAVYVQDEANGHIYQAASRPWITPGDSERKDHPKSARKSER
jgi:hypothetical protein